MKMLKHIFRNLKYYLPLITKDRDYDYAYIYNILAIKLQKVYDYRKSDDFVGHTNDEKDNKNILIAKILCKRLAKELHLDNACKGIEYVFDNDGWMFDLETTSKQIFQKCCKHSDYMEQQDKKYLFKLLEKEIENWWD